MVFSKSDNKQIWFQNKIAQNSGAPKTGAGSVWKRDVDWISVKFSLKWVIPIMVFFLIKQNVM